jgi:hypothetical protein
MPRPLSDGVRLARSRNSTRSKRNRRGQNRVAAEKVDLDLHRVAQPAEDVDVVPGFLLVAARRVIVDADLVVDVLVEIGIEIGLEDVLERSQLRLFLGLERLRLVQHFAVAVAQNVGREPSRDAQHARLEGRRQHRLHEGLAGLEVLAANGCFFLLRQLNQRRNIDRQVGRAIGKGNSLAERGVGVDLRGRNADVVIFQALFKGLDRLMHAGRLQEYLSRAGPDHDYAVDGLLEGLDVVDDLLGQVTLVLALLYVRAVQALHVILVEDSRQRLDGFQIWLELLERLLVQHLGVRGRLVDVVLENIPAGEDHIVQVRQRNKVLDQRRMVIGALAQPDGAHLRKRADRLGQSAAHRFHAGDHRGGHRAKANHHHAQLALRRRNLGGCLGPVHALFLCCHRFLPPLIHISKVDC